MFDLNRFMEIINPKKAGKNDNKKTVNKSKIVESIVQPKTKLLFGRYISFCIDDFSIQMAVSQHFGPKIILKDVTKIYLSKSLDTEEKKNSFINTSINDYIEQYSHLFTKFSLTISGQTTALRTFLMPALNKKALSAAIKYERKNQIPFPDENCVHDYKINSKIISKGKSKYKISLFATTYSDITNRIKRFSSGIKKINLWKIYHAQDSIGLMLRHLKEFKPDKKYTLLNQSRGYTEVSFYKGSQLQFYHINELTSAVQGGTYDTIKLNYYSETIEDQLRITFDYYNGQTNENPSREILVYGDLSYSDSLLEILGNNSSFKFTKFPISELKFLSNKKDEFNESLSASLPAMASVVCNTKSINLLPEKMVAKRKEFIQTVYSKLALGTMIVILSVAWFTMGRSTNIAKHQLEDINYSINKFKNSEAYHTYNNLKKQILNSRSYLKKTEKEPSYLSYNLKELSNLTPNQIKLIHFNFNPSKSNQNILIQGVVTSLTIPPEIILAEYTETLASSPLFDNVHIIKHVKKNKEEKFFIEFVINMQGVA